MIKDNEKIKSSFTIVPDSGHQINVEDPALLNPVLQNILNKYNWANIDKMDTKKALRKNYIFEI